MKFKLTTADFYSTFIARQKIDLMPPRRYTKILSAYKFKKDFFEPDGLRGSFFGTIEIYNLEELLQLQQELQQQLIIEDDKIIIYDDWIE